MAKTAQAEKSYLVFISHSMKDRWIARQIADLIERRGRRYGVKSFLDEKDIEGGESIPDLIRENIEACSEFVVLLSPYAIDRPWVLIEIGVAWGHHKRIVEILDKVDPEQMPAPLVEYKAIALNDFDQYLNQLISRAKGERE